MIALFLAVLAPVAAALLGENGAGTLNPAIHKASTEWKGQLPQVQPIQFLAQEQKPESSSKSPFIVPVAHDDKPKRGVAHRGINTGSEDVPTSNNLWEAIDLDTIPEGPIDLSSFDVKYIEPQASQLNGNLNMPPGFGTFDNFNGNGQKTPFGSISNQVKPQIIPLINKLNDHVKPQVMPLIDNLNDKIRPQVMPMIDVKNGTEPNFDPSGLVKPQVQLPLNGGKPSTVFPAANNNKEVPGVPLLNILANLTLECQKSFSNITQKVLNQTIGDFKTNFKAWAKKCGKEKEAEALESTSDQMRVGFKKNLTDLLEALPKAMADLEAIEDNENMTVTQKVQAVKSYMAGIKNKNVQKTVQFLEKLFLSDTITSIFPDKQNKKGASPEKSAINAFREFLTSKRIQKLPKEDKKNYN